EAPLPDARRARDPGGLYRPDLAPEPRPASRGCLRGVFPAHDPTPLHRRLRGGPPLRHGPRHGRELPPCPPRLPRRRRHPDGAHDPRRHPGGTPRRDRLPQRRLREGRRPLRRPHRPPPPPPLLLRPRRQPRRLGQPRDRRRGRRPRHKTRPQTRHRLLQPRLGPRRHRRARQGPRRPAEGVPGGLEQGPTPRRRGGDGQPGAV
ncbi:MAG: FIG140336: TPR domain protein, partial [uncultured Rubrobacteraceae bacterium]